MQSNQEFLQDLMNKPKAQTYKQKVYKIDKTLEATDVDDAEDTPIEITTKVQFNDMRGQKKIDRENLRMRIKMRGKDDSQPFKLKQQLREQIKEQEDDEPQDVAAEPAAAAAGVEPQEEKPYKISSNSLEKNDENGNLIEFPLLTTTFLGKKIPAAGGFYLRTLPMKVIKNAIRNQEEKQIPSSFYIHSWELTPEFMPRIDLPIKEKFITYHNLEKSMSKMTEIIKKFEFTTFKKYISNLN